MVGNPTRTIPAEYAGLENSSTLILVWAEPEILFDYPYVRLELATFIANRLRSKIKGIEVIEAARVEDHLERTLAWTADPEAVAKRFGVDTVIYLELLEMRMRRPETPTLLQGQISASVVLYNLRAGPDEPSRFELSTVTVRYPKEQPVLNTRGAAELVRQETYLTFAEQTARKFYDYKEEL